MRSEQEMYDLILGYAKRDARVRAVLLNGSRANPNAPRDRFQDFDIVYVVREFESMRDDPRWLDAFGDRLITQTPETMREPVGDGSFNWLMLFDDGNRMDLSLIPQEKPELIDRDSLTVVLLDKDAMMGDIPPSNDADYVGKAPDALNYYSCCNNFFWCLQNVAKGIERNETPYAMMMYHTVVRQELHDMLSWYIGAKNGFAVSCGKFGKYFKQYLSTELYALYETTYSGAGREEMWTALYTAAELFRKTARIIASDLGFVYNEADDRGMMRYLDAVRAGKE